MQEVSELASVRRQKDSHIVHILWKLLSSKVSASAGCLVSSRASTL